MIRLGSIRRSDGVFYRSKEYHKRRRQNDSKLALHPNIRGNSRQFFKGFRGVHSIERINNKGKTNIMKQMMLLCPGNFRFNLTRHDLEDRVRRNQLDHLLLIQFFPQFLEKRRGKSMKPYKSSESLGNRQKNNETKKKHDLICRTEKRWRKESIFSAINVYDDKHNQIKSTRQFSDAARLHYFSSLNRYKDIQKRIIHFIKRRFGT